MGEFYDKRVNGTASILAEDSNSAIFHSHNALVSKKSKHIDITWHFLKHHVEWGIIRLRYLPTERMVANMFITTCHDLHLHDIEVPHTKVYNQCNASTRSSLQGSVVSNTCWLLVTNDSCTLFQMNYLSCMH
jgi:hypothetical protein